MAGVGEVMGGLGVRGEGKTAKKWFQTREMLMMVTVRGKKKSDCNQGNINNVNSVNFRGRTFIEERGDFKAPKKGNVNDVNGLR